jgi:hypothetical protein
LSLDSWEYALLAVLIVSFVGVFVSALTLIWGLVGEYKDPHSSVMIEIAGRAWKVFPVLVIIGVGGELLFNTGSFVSSMVLEVLHSTAEQKAKKETAQINERAEKLEQGNLGLKKDLADTQRQLADSQRELQKQIERQGGRLSTVEEKTADRDISDHQRRIIRGKINGRRRPVTIVRLDDREAHAYADKLDKALTAAHFAVTKLDFGHTSPLTGVIVCENGGAEVKLFDALKAADMAPERRPSTDKYTQDHPPECQPDFAHPTAIRIFVGQRK